jgi:hypothetical protein
VLIVIISPYRNDEWVMLVLQCRSDASDILSDFCNGNYDFGSMINENPGYPRKRGRKIIFLEYYISVHFK